MEECRILIVDDERSTISSITNYFRNKYNIKGFTSPRQALALLKEKHYDILLVDDRMPEINGLEFFSEAQKCNGYTYGILYTTFMDKEQLADVLNKRLIQRYLPKPLNFQQLDICIKHAINHCLTKASRPHLKKAFIAAKTGKPYHNFHASGDRIIGVKNGLKNIYEEARQIASFPINVFISGETGTGKALFAHTIHLLSHRKKGPFISFNCRSVPDRLKEAELFGYTKDAFSQARTGKPGILELAHKGTLFLEDLEGLDRNLQKKLCTALEKKETRRLGSAQPVQVDVRLISSSSKNFDELLRARRFREDLFYLLNEASLHLPPLRERKEDLKQLIAYFINKYSFKWGINCPEISKRVYNFFMDQPWQGNIKELADVINQLVVFCNHRKHIELTDLAFLNTTSLN